VTIVEQVFSNLTGGGPISVYVKDGKIVRVRPLQVLEEDYKPWVIEVGDKKFSPPKALRLAPYVHAERNRLNSENRILYPMKRVDFDPKGERNTQNRGKSGYVRISWEEALDIVSGEMKRVRATYGDSAIIGDDVVASQLGDCRLQDGSVPPLHAHAQLHAGSGQPG
jgi:anaerobic selenocysteine-containing dehydrogenase